MKLQCRSFSQSEDMEAQTGHLGGGVNSSTFGHFVSGSMYFVHFWGGYEAWTNKLGSVQDPTAALCVF